MSFLDSLNNVGTKLNRDRTTICMFNFYIGGHWLWRLPVGHSRLALRDAKAFVEKTFRWLSR
jgi:hypothetical protein